MDHGHISRNALFIDSRTGKGIYYEKLNETGNPEAHCIKYNGFDSIGKVVSK